MAKMYFYYSAMNAGKSTNLLQSSHNYQERGMRTLIFTPLVDNRHAKGIVHSRIGIHAQGNTFDTHFDFLAFLKQQVSMPHCILIDEAQFLTKQQVLQLSDITDLLNIPVLAFGLRTDFRGEPFEGSLYLLAWADELLEIKTICHCGSKATMNIRLDEHGNKTVLGEQVHIGGNQEYTAVCRKHYKLGVVESIETCIES